MLADVCSSTAMVKFRRHMSLFAFLIVERASHGQRIWTVLDKLRARWSPAEVETFLGSDSCEIPWRICVSRRCRFVRACFARVSRRSGEDLVHGTWSCLPTHVLECDQKESVHAFLGCVSLHDALPSREELHVFSRASLL